MLSGWTEELLYVKWNVSTSDIFQEVGKEGTVK